MRIVDTKIKYVADIFGRIGFRGYTEQDVTYEGNGAITLSPSNFHDMKMDYGHLTYLSWDKYYESPEIQIENGDILFVKTGSTYGKSCFVSDLPMEATINPQLIVFKNFKMNAKLFAYVLQTDEIRNQCELAVVGGTIPTMSQKKIGNFQLQIPFYPEDQNAVVKFLDAKCAEIDALTVDIQTQIDTLEQYKCSVITEAVTRGLDKNVEMKESGIEWAEQIPVHWRTMHNKYLMHKVKEICPVYNGEDILSLTMQGVIVRDFELGGKMPASFDGYQIIHPGNLLMCLFDYDVTPRCIGYINNEGLTSPAYSQFVMEPIADAHYYYYYYLMLDFTKELLHLAKNLRHSFTEEQLGEINTVVPPVNEQREIAGYLDKKVANIDEAISLKNDQLSTLDAYKKSTIYEYVTGKKEVPAV